MKKIFSLAFLLLITFSLNAALLDNIAGFWKLDETSGNALDANGNYNGTVTGTTRGITGKFGNAYNFDGTINNNIDLGSNANILMGTTDYSISVWIKTNAGVTLSSSDNLYTIISNQSSGSALGYTLFLRGGTYNGILFRIGNGSSYYDLKPTANVSTTVIDGNWHHIVVAVDRDGTSNLYLDGSTVGNTSFSSISSTNITYSANMKIGLHSESGGSLPFNGKLDDIGLWKRTITSTDVSSLYANTPSFSTTSYTLSVSPSPAAGGSITLSPAGGTYTSGTSVTATATANSGYIFTGWSGASTASTNAVVINMDGNKSLNANFSSAPGVWTTNGTNIYFSTGNVGIGTSNPTQPLTVNGKILAEEIEVASNITADFVFEQNYPLMKLSEVDAYIHEYKHLPGIPSAEEFCKNGQNLGEMDNLLLLKIEELTLYILNQEETYKKLIQDQEQLRIQIEKIKASKSSNQ